jgi:DNA-binding transcriptional LysR family regulator
VFSQNTVFARQPFQAADGINMRFEDLEAFLTVSETASFSAAAEQLHLTQPAITRRIQQLESRLNARLFDRVGRRVHLTHAGETLLPRARELLSGLADAQRAIGNLSAQIDGTLKLATSHHIGLHRLAPVLKRYARTYPEVALDIRFEDSEAAHELIRHGDSELAVVTLNPAGDDDLNAIELWDDRLCFVCSHDHPLRQHRQLSLAALAQHPVILPGPRTYTGRIVAQLFESRNIALSATLSTNYLETISMLVSTGLGWSVLPQSMSEGLCVLQTQAPEIARTLGCITNPQRTLSSAASAFIEILVATAAAADEQQRAD